jgi:hypothetical protein
LRLEKFSKLRSRAKLAIASFIIHHLRWKRGERLRRSAGHYDYGPCEINTSQKATYRDEFGPVGKNTLHAHLFGEERVDVAFYDKR